MFVDRVFNAAFTQQLIYSARPRGGLRCNSAPIAGSKVSPGRWRLTDYCGMSAEGVRTKCNLRIQDLSVPAPVAAQTGNRLRTS